ncbi:acetyltransferase [Brevibacillus porteri]|uniref:acetyltransferase n=1 Tax=Brevibacillus porteri TaxID=2126350 RepID=UPI003D225D18
MKPVILLGGGGHAKVLLDSLILQGHNILGFTDPQFQASIWGIPYLGHDEEIEKFSPKDIALVNGIGAVGNNSIRKKLFCLYKERGYCFAKVIHPTAIVSPRAVIDEGAQIMAGAVMQANVHICSNVIVNTRVSIDHDCKINDHVHIAPGATLSGGVQIEESAFVGAGAVVIQGIRIGTGSIVGAGAVVIKDVPRNRTVAGVPAKVIG